MSELSDEPVNPSNGTIGYMVKDQMSPSGARYHIMDDTLENRALLAKIEDRLTSESMSKTPVRTGVPDIRVGINAERPEYKDSILK